MNVEAHFGQATDEWSTPPDLLRPIADAVGGFDLDPCSGAEERSIAATTYTADDDGLSQAWFGRVWMNPPYSDIERWMKKARGEIYRPDTETIVALVPARVSTQWFQRYAANADLVTFIEGRLKFGQAENSAPFPSCLAVYGRVPDDLRDVLVRRGVTYSLSGRVRTSEQATIGFGEEVRGGGE